MLNKYIKVSRTKPCISTNREHMRDINAIFWQKSHLQRLFGERKSRVIVSMKTRRMFDIFSRDAIGFLENRSRYYLIR